MPDKTRKHAQTTEQVQKVQNKQKSILEMVSQPKSLKHFQNSSLCVFDYRIFVEFSHGLQLLSQLHVAA